MGKRAGDEKDKQTDKTKDKNKTMCNDFEFNTHDGWDTLQEEYSHDGMVHNPSPHYKDSRMWSISQNDKSDNYNECKYRMSSIRGGWPPENQVRSHAINRI